jgi:hypothetical protein
MLQRMSGEVAGLRYRVTWAVGAGGRLLWVGARFRREEAISLPSGSCGALGSSESAEALVRVSVEGAIWTLETSGR